MKGNIKIFIIVALLLNTSLLIFLMTTKTSSFNDSWISLVKFVYIGILLFSVYNMIKKK